MSGYLAENVTDWIYIDISDQHEDSIRFIKDCEKALGIKIQILKSNEYNSTDECFDMFGGFTNKANGFALCTNWLKKRVRKQWEEEHAEDDLMYVWGFDLNEKHRAERTIEANPQAKHEFPLIEKCLSKEEVHGLFERNFDFKRPLMYDMGYPNNNCVGCIKGGMGYWNKIRKDFPEVFAKRIKQEQKYGKAILKEADGTPLFLKDLDENRGNMNTEIFSECGVMCFIADYTNK